MTFASLKTVFFRNLAGQECDTGGKNIFLVGENGQGKSNFLEALYFSAYGSSFRGSRDGDMVRAGERACSVRAGFAGSVHDSVLVKIEHGKKTINLDGKALQDRKELLSVIPCVVFCHEDMDFVSGPPESRRRFFDQVQSLYDPFYLEYLRRYRQVLKARNAILRPQEREAGGVPGGQSRVLDSLDFQLAEYGLALMEKRKEAVKHFSALFGPFYAEVSGIRGIGVQYVPSWREDSQGEVIRRLAEKRELEMIRGMSLSGPHRDRYVFFRDGSEFAGYASTGQRRLLALLLRSAQALRFSHETGKKPVLLLDDVLLELDPEKRRRFLALMPEYDQAFYTFLPEEPWQRYQGDGDIAYEVKDGVLERIQNSVQ